MKKAPKGPSDAEKAALKRQEEEAGERKLREASAAASRQRRLKSARQGRQGFFASGDLRGIKPTLGAG